MRFHITGLAADPFRPLFGLPEAELARRNARRYIADDGDSYPDRIELRHARRGEAVLLVNYEHQSAPSPYRAAHAVFVLEGAGPTFDRVGVVPEVLRPRLLSLRAFDAQHWMIDADVVDGAEVETLIERLFADPQVAYLHAHFARRGCYACRIDRVAAS
ncbi:MAG: DUF1203 domain-containing protein [Gemmatimonadota bacterium]